MPDVRQIVSCSINNFANSSAHRLSLTFMAKKKQCLGNEGEIKLIRDDFAKPQKGDALGLLRFIVRFH